MQTMMKSHKNQQKCPIFFFLFILLLNYVNNSVEMKCRMICFLVAGLLKCQCVYLFFLQFFFFYFIFLQNVFNDNEFKCISLFISLHEWWTFVIQTKRVFYFVLCVCTRLTQLLHVSTLFHSISVKRDRWRKKFACGWEWVTVKKCERKSESGGSKNRTKKDN